MDLVPPVLLGVAATMVGIYWLKRRLQKVSDKELKNGEKK